MAAAEVASIGRQVKQFSGGTGDGEHGGFGALTAFGVQIVIPAAGAKRQAVDLMP